MAPSHHRLRELLAIPERNRTETEWAEINELEITLTPINRAVVQEQNLRRKGTPGTAQPKSREGPTRSRQLKSRVKGRPEGGDRGEYGREHPLARLNIGIQSGSAVHLSENSFFPIFRIRTDLLSGVLKKDR